jgi:hypothetical protein
VLTPAVTVEGLPVEAVTTSPTAPAVTSGRIRVANRSDVAVAVRVDAVRVLAEGADHPVGAWFLYRLPGYEEIDAGELVLAAGEDTSLELSFAAVPAAPADRPRVEVAVEVDGDASLVESPVTLVVRTPRGPSQHPA